MTRPDFNFLLASFQPQRLAQFYADALDGEIIPGISKDHWWIICSDGLKLQIFRPSDKRPFPSKGRNFSFCLQALPSTNPLHFLMEWSSKFELLGGKVREISKLNSFGYEAWIADPEGNEFLLVAPLR